MKITPVSAHRILVPDFITGGSYHVLLALLLAVYALGPFLRGPEGALLITLVWIAILVSAIAAVARTRRALVTGVITMAAVTVAGDVADRALDTGMVIETTLRSLLVLFVTVVITRSVFATRHITLRTISGSICIFLLMGLLWATLYTLVEELAPGSFRGLPDIAGLDVEASNDALISALYYYSYVTLTTLGFGDVVPVTELTRTLSTLEAIAGQIYLVVAVARLVGLHIAGEARRWETDQQEVSRGQ